MSPPINFSLVGCAWVRACACWQCQNDQPMIFDYYYYYYIYINFFFAFALSFCIQWGQYRCERLFDYKSNEWVIRLIDRWIDRFIERTNFFYEWFRIVFTVGGLFLFCFCLVLRPPFFFLNNKSFVYLFIDWLIDWLFYLWGVVCLLIF